jgi:hypothetical protein
MQSENISRRVFISLGGLILAAPVFGQDLSPLGQSDKIYYDTPAAREAIEKQIKELLGKEIGGYAAIEKNNGTKIRTAKERANVATQFLQTYGIMDTVYQTPNGNLMIAAHEVHNADQISLILLHGNSINILATALIHSNCAKGVLEAAIGMVPKVNSRNPCDDRPTLTVFYPANRQPDAGDLQSFTRAASVRLQRLNIATSKKQSKLLIGGFSMELRKV